MAVSSARNEQLRRYVENRHIDHIPPGARHGKPWHQFAFWFGGNVNVFKVVLGAVTVSIGLTFWWALIAIGAGTVIGALLIALHATQGPRLGVPQSIQSRGQFGFYGSAFMFPAVLALNVGFIAAELVIQAQAMNGVTSALSIPQWIIILAVPSVVIGVFGYRWIHWVMQATAVVVGVSLIVMLAQGLRYGALAARETAMTAPPAGLFLAGVALLVIDLLSSPGISSGTNGPSDCVSAAQRLMLSTLPCATGVVQVCYRRVAWLSCVMSSRLADRAAARSWSRSSSCSRRSVLRCSRWLIFCWRASMSAGAPRADSRQACSPSVPERRFSS